MKHLFIITGLSLLLAAGQLSAESEETIPKDNETETVLGVKLPKSNISATHNIGVAAGFVSGFGLSYRHWIPGSKFGFQITATPIYSENKDEGTRYINASFGLNGLTKLATGDFADLFLYYGFHYWVYQDKHIETFGYYDNSTYTSYSRDTLINERSEVFQFGVGPGVDLHIGRISYNIMVGIRGGVDQVSSDRFVKISGETALYYRF